MHYTALFSLALPVLAAATVIDVRQTNTTGSCNTGNTLCCNSVQNLTSTSITQLASMVGIALPDLNGLVGLTCSGITALGAGGTSCSQQPVCCTQNSFSGLLAFGCNPLNLNL